ncbi:putative glucosylceramidase 1 [Colletotrichum sp. SAR 10_70]|nr:putative glucosylceramidase 1 [Colletotrichum sp. SAR 10_71]KAI8193580.1 putative glucosylceramidase 1 [Colletotrichum sp. SAR 10_70]KAI8197067.1 putative glucosylceramidase 1 [Colletotrichum sp. SAR 10_65]KAJ5008085.1 putative glucosylceramidase 1 [Colletotrichum sp. SAR 10_66]
MVLLSTLIAVAGLGAVARGQITVDTSSKLQKIDGFGFSQAFGRAKEFQNAPSALQKEALDLLFSTDKGAGFSIIRNRIGSGGKGDSILPTSPGSPSGKPTYSWDDDDSGQVWFTKQAVSYGVKQIYADAWSAPGFMKTSGNEATAGYLCGTTGHTCSSGDWRQAYADFLVQYVKYYQQAGLNVTHLGFLNEPDFSPGYSQMQISFNAQEAISFIPTLSKAVQAAGLNTKLTCCDAVGWGSTVKYTNALVAGGMESYLGLITSHTYSGDANTALDTKLASWVTESGITNPFDLTWYKNGGATEGMTWANKIAVGIINAKLSAYLYWEGFELKQLQSDSHLVDTQDGKTATPSANFWAFAMWSRHIRPGAQRLATSGMVASDVLTAAVQNADGSVVVVFTNNGSAAKAASVSFKGFTPKAASAWVTDNSHKFDATQATVSGSGVSVSVPSKGVVTVKLT